MTAYADACIVCPQRSRVPLHSDSVDAGVLMALSKPPELPPRIIVVYRRENPQIDRAGGLGPVARSQVHHEEVRNQRLGLLIEFADP